MLGATVMPHAIYLHSSLTRDRHGVPHPDPEVAAPRISRLLSATKVDVILALFVAGGVNIAMLLLAAASLPGVGGTDTIEGAAAAITEHLGATVGLIFAVGLLISGLASTSVGAYAGSEIMAGLLQVRIPLLARRIITIIPALILLGVGLDPTWALVISQVVLSFGIPFALVPLLRLTGDAALMGRFVNRVPLRAAGWIVTAAIIALNVLLIVLTLAGS